MEAEHFFGWFKSHGGSIDEESVGLSYFEDTRCQGAVALHDIPEGRVLFSIPRDLLLSTRTCSLEAELGHETWKTLGKGWSPLVLCMMWESTKGSSSKWDGYFDVLPKTFTTPMFWSKEDLEELSGSTILEKIGREDAEQEYNNKVLPIIQSRPDLFKPEHISTFYSTDSFHIMGSRILSRSFHVEKWKSEHEQEPEEDAEDKEEEEENSPPPDHAMEIDEVPPIPLEVDPSVSFDSHDAAEEDGEDDEDDGEDVGDVSMVPVADMLNARYGCSQAHLFYEKDELKMITTKPIKVGEQIWNTYGDPPNSDLLRRYGHVDLVPLPGPENLLGNPADDVEIKADLVVEIVPTPNSKDRIDWWLEEGGDDVFVLETNYALPDLLISLIRLLLMSNDEWEKTREKGKPPKAKLEPSVIEYGERILKKRLDKYNTNIQVDETLLRNPSLSQNKRNAIVVRLGEKRILTGALQNLEDERKKITPVLHKGKRKGDSGDGGRKEKKIRR